MSESKSRDVKKIGGGGHQTFGGGAGRQVVDKGGRQVVGKGGGHQNMSGENLEAFAGSGEGGGELLYPFLPYPVLSCILYHREHIEEERLVVDEGDKLGDEGEELEGEM